MADSQDYLDQQLSITQVMNPTGSQAAQQSAYDHNRARAAGGDMGDVLDTPEQRAQDNARGDTALLAPSKSPFAGRFKAPQWGTPEFDAQSRRLGQRETPPDPKRLTFVPGAPPDTVMDAETGDVYIYNSKDDVVYGGNITMPQFNELTRGSAAVAADLTRRGVLAPVTAKPLKGDHGWKTKVSPEVPGQDRIRSIDVNAPTLDDIAANLSRESGTIWAQIDRSKKRAIGIGSVLATAASSFLGPALGTGGILATGLSGTAGSAVSVGASAAAAGLGALAGQAAGHGGNLGDIDWNEVVRKTLTAGAGGAAGAVIGAGAGAVGLPDWAIPGVSAGARQAATQGIGAVLPKPGQGHITAYQPYPGVSPDRARAGITRLGY